MRNSVIIRFFIAGLLFLIPVVALAQNLSSPNYRVEDSTFDSGGESSSSTNYRSRDSLGDLSDGGSNSTSYKVFGGFVLPAYPGVPGQPTFTNTGGTFYTSLDFVVTTGGNPSDVNYAIAISTDNFVTTNFVQTDDTVGPTEAWQTYANWGSGTGERITGLLPSTTYKIKVKARYGANSETGYSLEATASTAAPNLTITFTGVNSGTSIAGETTSITSTTNAIAYGSLVVSTPKIAAHKVTVTTNAVAGYTTTVQHDGELRTTTSQQIDSVSGTNASPAAWPGGITTGRFGYHTTDSLLCTGTAGRFSSNDTYAALTTSPLEVACNTGPVTAEETTLVYKLEIGSVQPAGSYQNIVTYITTAQF